MTALVTEHLPLVAGAPEGIRKLRELILELAVRGKLVEQDPTDEAAQELLERIAVKRATHSKVAKSIAPLSDEDLIYPLPLGWAWTRLASQVYESGAGWSPSCEARPKTGDEWGVLKVSAVSWGRFSPDENKALPASLVPRPEHQVTVGDFLVSRANTSDLVARSVVVEATAPRLMLSDKIVRLKLTPDCCARYINLVNTCPASRRYYGLVAGGTSSSMKNVSREQILHLPLPLPPLAEQHRIVAKVDELMALCDRLEADQADAEAAHAQLVQALLDSLTQATDAADFRAHWQRLSEHFHTLFTTEASIDALKQMVLRLGFMGKLVPQQDSADDSSRMIDAITEAKAQLPDAGRLRQADDSAPATRGAIPFEFPASWQVARMADLSEPITSGATPPSSEMDESEGVPFLKVYNIRDQQIDFGYKPQFVKEHYHLSKLRRSALKPNDVVMNIVGPPLGKTAIIPDDYPAWNCNQAIVFFRLIPPMNPRYVHLFLCEGSFVEGIDLIGTAGQDNISVTKSRNIVIPVPTSAEQHRIVAKVDELMALCDQLKAQLADARQQHAQLATALIEQAVA